MTTGSLDTSSLRTELAERGFSVVRSVFGGAEVAGLRKRMRELVDEARAAGKLTSLPGREGVVEGRRGELLTQPGLRDLVYDDRVVEIARVALGATPVYFGDSTFAVGSNGERGWHRDNVDRGSPGPDWQDRYPVVRCGIYLQDHENHSGGLAVRAGSHEPSTVGTTWKARLNAKLRTHPVAVPSRSGDVVVWPLTLVHSGEVVRTRPIDHVWPPRIQQVLPRSLRIEMESIRMVAFITYGARSPLLGRYLEFLRTRDYARESWAASSFDTETMSRLLASGLELEEPIPGFGGL